MAKTKKDTSSLGKGLAAIFGDDIESVLDDIQQGVNEEHSSGKIELNVADIKPNPYQPRKQFDDAKISELADSIRLHGVFTPILVKKAIHGYELVTGERRLRATKLAGLSTIPAIIVEFDDQQMMEIALLENIQRENLNAIEEANAYDKLITKLNYTQEELANRIGKSRTHVTNMLRLRKLPEEVAQYVISNELSMGHVRALLGLNEEDMLLVAKKAIQDKMSVRGVEALVKKLNSPKKVTEPKQLDPQYRSLQDRLQEKFQTQVKLDDKQIVFRYHGTDDLNRLLEILNCLEEE